MTGFQIALLRRERTATWKAGTYLKGPTNSPKLTPGGTIAAARWLVAVSVLAVPAIATSCDGREAVERRGSIMVRDMVMLELPAEFQVNQPDTVVVTTFGNSCISFARTEVTVQGLIATVEPYDFDEVLTQDLDEPVVCNDVQVEVPHPAELVFATTGEATIQFTGLHKWADSVGWHDSIITVERRVPVR